MVDINHYTYRSIEYALLGLEKTGELKRLFFSRVTDDSFKTTILGYCITNAVYAYNQWTDNFNHVFDKILRKYYIQELLMCKVFFPLNLSRIKFEKWLRLNDYTYRKAEYTNTHVVYLVAEDVPIESYKARRLFLKKEDPVI